MSAVLDLQEFFRTLDKQKFAGFCMIEREAGNQRLEDIKAARDYVAQLPA